jgi:hypothetical protein
MEAIHAQNERDFDTAIEKWRDVLKRNNNFDEAYVQIGLAYYRAGDYEQAVEYYKLAYETENYSDAYREIRKMNTQKYLWLIPIVAIALLVGLSKFFKYAGRVNKETALKVGRKSFKEELLYVFHVIFHPFDGFWDLKHEKRGNFKAGIFFLVITFVAYVYNGIGQSFWYDPYNSGINILGELSGVLLPFVLWVVSNWCLTTLFEGEGSLKDICLATCYSLIPLPLMMIPATILTHILTLEEGTIITLLVSIGYIWTGMLLFFGVMVTHDYSFSKNILTVVGTLAGMVIIMFIGILFTTLLGKIVSFVSNIIIEINYRL